MGILLRCSLKSSVQLFFQNTNGRVFLKIPPASFLEDQWMPVDG